MNAICNPPASTVDAPRAYDAGATAAEGGQYLTFEILDEEFGVEILRVQEIKNFSKITPIPNTPRYIKGAMNLRGTVVPIIDLRCKFGMPEAEYTRFTVIIVVTVGARVMGLIVDAVSDVLDADGDDLEAAPDFGADVDTSFMTGIAKSGDRLITLLNIDKLIGVEQLDAIA